MTMKYTNQRELEIKTVSRSGISPNNRMTKNHHNQHSQHYQQKHHPTTPSCKLDNDINRLQWELKEIRMKSKQRQRLRIEEQRKARRLYRLKHQQYHKIAAQIWRACTSTTAIASIVNTTDASSPSRNQNKVDGNSKKNGFLRHNFYVYSNFLQQEIFPQHQYETAPSIGSRNQITTMATTISSSSSRTILALTTEILRSLHGVAISTHQLELLQNEWNTLQRWSSQTSGREKDMKILVESRLLSRIENMWAETSFIQRNASPVIEEQRKEIHKLSQGLWRRSLSEGGVEDNSNYYGPICQTPTPRIRNHRAQASIVTPPSNKKRHVGAFTRLQRSNSSGSDDSMVTNRLQQATSQTHQIITPQIYPRKLVGGPAAKQPVAQKETISKKDSNQAITQSKPQGQQNVLPQEQSSGSSSPASITKSDSPSFHTWPTFLRRNSSCSIPGSITNTADECEPDAGIPPMPQAPRRRSSLGMLSLSRNNSSRSISRNSANTADECEFDSEMPPMPQAPRRRASYGLLQGTLSSNNSSRSISRNSANTANECEFDSEMPPMPQAPRRRASYGLLQGTLSSNNNSRSMAESTNTTNQCGSGSGISPIPQAPRRRSSFGLLQPRKSKDNREDLSQEEDHQANSTATSTIVETPDIRSIFRRQNGCRKFAGGNSWFQEKNCKDGPNCLLDDEDDDTTIVRPSCPGTMHERPWLDKRPGFSRQNSVRSVAKNKSGDFEDEDDIVPPIPSAPKRESSFGRLWKTVSTRELLDIRQIEEDMDSSTTCRTITTAATSSEMISLDTRPSTSSDSIGHYKSYEYEQEGHPMPPMPPSPRRNSSFGWLWENISKGEIEEDSTVTRTFERLPLSKVPSFHRRINSRSTMQCESDDDEAMSPLPPSPPHRKTSFGLLWENITTSKDGVTANMQQRKEEEDVHSTSTISSVDTASATLSLGTSSRKNFLPNTTINRDNIKNLEHGRMPSIIQTCHRRPPLGL